MLWFLWSWVFPVAAGFATYQAPATVLLIVTTFATIYASAWAYYAYTAGPPLSAKAEARPGATWLSGSARVSFCVSYCSVFM